MLTFARKFIFNSVAMEFRTRVELPVKQCRITHEDKLMLWGSCFAENIGKILSENKFGCDVNPFGVLYNPMSVSKAMRMLLDDRRYAPSDLRFDRGLWYSLMHHSLFSSEDREECLRRINERLENGSENLRKARWIIFTWGTARVYEWAEDGAIVGNCHKLPERFFRRRLLEVEEIVASYRQLLADVRRINPEANILFTVSPIRHARDGFHENQVSKATLLIAISKLCSECDRCFYFPSYEILMDELRDYRFYADDMLHPSPLAVTYIWQCFCTSYFDEATMQVIKSWSEIRRGLEHRPSAPESEEYRRFLSQILLKIERLKENFPYLDVENERTLCQTRLKK